MNLTIRDLKTYDDLKQVEDVEREVWGVSDRDVVPLALAIASAEAGNLWLGAFDATRLAGFAFAFLSLEDKSLTFHSHLLAVREPYRQSNLGYSLKQIQRQRALALGVPKINLDFRPTAEQKRSLQLRQVGNGQRPLSAGFLRLREFELIAPQWYRSPVADLGIEFAACGGARSRKRQSG